MPLQSNQKQNPTLKPIACSSQQPWDLFTPPLPLKGSFSFLSCSETIPGQSSRLKHKLHRGCRSLCLLYNWIPAPNTVLNVKWLLISKLPSRSCPAHYCQYRWFSEHVTTLHIPAQIEFYFATPSPQYHLELTQTFLCDKPPTENTALLKTMANWKTTEYCEPENKLSLFIHSLS